MSRNGVWQLRKLAICYCDFSGSSRGAREFVKDLLPAFKEANPQIAIHATVRRGYHPNMDARYANSMRRVVSLRNAEPREIMRQAQLLRNSTGRKASLPIKEPVVAPYVKGPRGEPVRATRSVQGVWRPGMFDSAQAGF